MGCDGQGGGSFALGELIDQHPGPIAADFAHHYPGLELGRIVQDWPPDLVLALIEWLPDDGAYAAARRGGREFYGWGQTRQLAADTWDLMVAIGMAGSKKKAPKYPRPTKRSNSKTWGDVLRQFRAK